MSKNNKKVKKETTKHQDYIARQKRRGLFKAGIWVPTDDVEKVKAYCERLRKKAIKEGRVQPDA